MDDEVTLEFKEMGNEIDKLGNKVHSFRKVRFGIKVIGIAAMFAMAASMEWFYAFVLWLLFFPDSEDIIRYLHKISTKINENINFNSK